MEREKIEKVDLEELLGKRLFVEKTIYEEFVEGIGMLLCSYLNIKIFFCIWDIKEVILYYVYIRFSRVI